MEHLQDDPREALDPQDGGRDDLIGEVMRMLRLLSAQAKSKQNLSRRAGSGGCEARNGVNTLAGSIRNVSHGHVSWNRNTELVPVV